MMPPPNGVPFGQQPPQPPQNDPPYDLGNQLIGETPARLTIGEGGTANGKRMLLTIRTPSTTLTLLLSREDAQAWADYIRRAADQMGGLITP